MEKVLPIFSGVEQLRERIIGAVISPSDPEYDNVRQGWNLSVKQQPAVIVVAEAAEDVQEAVLFAREVGLDVAVMSTGHGTIRAADGSLLIVTSRLAQVRVEPQARIAWIGAGARWGAVLEKCQEYGLAPLLGSSPTVGVVGYTLGGGMGWLARKYGLAADSVRYFVLVTADGQLLRVSVTENSELFWALRGGGGNFGVIVGMEIQLYPVATVYGGSLFYPVEMAREVFARYRTWIAELPDEMTTSVSVMNYPPLPVVPEPIRGKSFAVVRGCYCGSPEQGEALVQPWREWQTPLMDGFQAMPFADVAMISQDPVDPVPGLSSGAWLNDLSDEAIAIMLDHVVPRGGPPALLKLEVRHAGGAISAVSEQAGAYSHRQQSLVLQMVGITPTAEAYHGLEQYIAGFKQALASHLSGAVYMNFLEGAEARASASAAYLPESYARLQRVKAQYDPQNCFSHSYNIPPAA